MDMFLITLVIHSKMSIPLFATCIVLFKSSVLSRLQNNYLQTTFNYFHLQMKSAFGVDAYTGYGIYTFLLILTNLYSK